MKYPFDHFSLIAAVNHHKDKLPPDMGYSETLIGAIKAAIWLLRQPPEFLLDRESVVVFKDEPRNPRGVEVHLPQFFRANKEPRG